MKLQLVYLPYKNMSCIQHPHYDLCTKEKDPKGVACILSSGKESNKILKKMVKVYNDYIHGKEKFANLRKKYGI